RRLCLALLDLSSLPCASKAASSAAKIPQTYLAEMCEAVLPERIFVQTRNWTQGILGVLSRTIAMYGRKSARQNRCGFDSRWTKQKGQEIIPALLNCSLCGQWPLTMAGLQPGNQPRPLGTTQESWMTNQSKSRHWVRALPAKLRFHNEKRNPFVIFRDV
ncbi:MAG: hypothetical protein J6J12_06480, partial [Oscillospiraceae bacterium]|nr:hypothetical protein [Oscillospiraceae bacterium]